MARALLLLILGYTAVAAHAETCLVRPDGSGDYPTIQSAIDGCAPGDTVMLADGIFTGDGNRNLDFAGKALLLRSQSGQAEACILDPTAVPGPPGFARRGFFFQSGETQDTRIEALTVTHGEALDE